MDFKVTKYCDKIQSNRNDKCKWIKPYQSNNFSYKLQFPQI